jgi:hypothetical protein
MITKGGKYKMSYGGKYKMSYGGKHKMSHGRKYRSKKHTRKQNRKHTRKHTRKHLKKRKNKSKKYKGGSSLGSAYVNDGLLSTSYTLGNVTPQNLALANPIPIDTYSKCPQ